MPHLFNRPLYSTVLFNCSSLGILYLCPLLLCAHTKHKPEHNSSVIGQLLFHLQENALMELKKELQERPTRKLVDDLKKKVQILQVFTKIAYCNNYTY
jgi:hypothetical protein